MQLQGDEQDFSKVLVCPHLPSFMHLRFRQFNVIKKIAREQLCLLSLVTDIFPVPAMKCFLLLIGLSLQLQSFTKYGFTELSMHD